jgi:23S rRNA (uracil1939-C5)-methyltransferase
MPIRKRRRQRKPASPKIPPVVTSITDLSRSGTGVGHDHEGRALFVPFTAPGDVVKVKLHKVKRRYAEGELLEVIESSPIRVAPLCPVFSRCGGCQWQHIPYELQWQTKEAGVHESLRLAKIDMPQVWQGFPAKDAWEYRNRIQLRVEGATIGFYARQSNTLVPIQRCEIAHPAINKAIAEVRAKGEKDSAFKGKGPYKVELFLEADGSVQCIWNEVHGAAGFRQINDVQNASLQAWIKGAVAPATGILDLYGGNGNLSLSLVDRASEVHCVDISSPEDRTVNVPENFYFHRSPVLPWLQQRMANSRRKNLSFQDKSWTVLIDPPREGLGEEGPAIIDVLEEHNAQTAILVGCKSDPWARDVARFIERGWQLQQVAVFDFFPQTSHVESVALLAF